VSGTATPRLALALLACAAVAGAAERPRLLLEDAAGGCPTIGGSFVALLRPERGMVLLSAAEFLGGRRVGTAAGGALRLALPEAGSPELARAVTAAGTAGVWGAVYPFTGEPARGCVAFDRDRFSSEGDLVTYLRWLVDEVYLGLPAAERAARPAFAIGAREVAVRIEGLGFQPLRLAGREGAAMLFRLPGVERTFLLTPFVLDAGSGRIAAFVASTTEAFWQGGEKQTLGVVVAASGAPGALADPPLTVAVETVSAAP